jgi:predicted CoA-substrate-specific enzyme activase
MKLIFAGCDLGTITAKAVIIENGNILSSEILPYKCLPRQAAADVIDAALRKAGLKREDVSCCLATGFGKKAVPNARAGVPELICISRAIHSLDGGIRTVIDAGGHSIKALNIDDIGRVTTSTANDKCAAGTGKFMEVMAHALEMPLEELSIAALDSKNPLPVTSQCGVFAESEVITHVNEGHSRYDIFAGISLSVASKIDLIQPIAMIGGLAKSRILIRDLETELGLFFISFSMDPQAIGAYGAALIAGERANPELKCL